MLSQGADLIILERSLIEMRLGQKGEFPENDRLRELVQRVELESIVFEAKAVVHQAWLFNTFGPDVNIGPNVEPRHLAKLQTTRRTLKQRGWLHVDVR